ncbi:hypothetical protein DXG03_004400 [Asterophora parasitica]|uniref:Uncharacterized protein n=1 Tax=Asterophora parasitica TaxID=117018 RepID=A0A9P7K909_9AGAR|nr:hypothetical protein DXG03_004400 [Asterophora parasitica]
MGPKARARATSLLKTVNSLAEGFSDPFSVIPAVRAVLKVMERIGSVREDVEKLAERCVELLDVVIIGTFDPQCTPRERHSRLLHLTRNEDYVAELCCRMAFMGSTIRIEDGVIRIEDKVIKIDDKILQLRNNETRRMGEVLLRTNAQLSETVRIMQLQLTSHIEDKAELQRR